MRKLKQEDFVNISNIQHNFFFDYSRAVYENRRGEVEIGCPKHGWFNQQAGSHMYGRGCSKCANNNLYDKKEFLELAFEKHQLDFNYDNSEYKGMNKEIEIRCNKCNYIFKQNPATHLRENAGCPKCGRIKEQELYVTQCNLKHNSLYSYNNLIYTGSNNEVIITCKEHGDFEQRASSHLQGRGCTKCFRKRSQLEKEIFEFIEQITSNVEYSNKKLIGMELDILIPDNKIAIEVNGEYWHYIKKNGRKNHVKKSKLCKEKGYKLLHLREDLWKFKKEHMKQVIIKLIQNV